MTLGRTASNAIKIKTDGTIRAVNCACCVGEACACIFVSDSLKSQIESATTVTGQGVSAPWNGSIAIIDPVPPSNLRTWSISYSSGRLCVYLDDGAEGGSMLLPPGLTPEDCLPGFPYCANVIIIQGESLPAFDFFCALSYTPTLSFS